MEAQPRDKPLIELLRRILTGANLLADPMPPLTGEEIKSLLFLMKLIFKLRLTLFN